MLFGLLLGVLAAFLRWMFLALLLGHSESIFYQFAPVVVGQFFCPIWNASGWQTAAKIKINEYSERLKTGLVRYSDTLNTSGLRTLGILNDV